MAVLGGGGDEGGDGENIWVAASDGDLDRVRQLLTRGVAVNARDELGYNPLCVIHDGPFRSTTPRARTRPLTSAQAPRRGHTGKRR